MSRLDQVCLSVLASENTGQRAEQSAGRRHEPVHSERAGNFGARTGENRPTGGRPREEAAQADGGRLADGQRERGAAHAAVVHARQQEERAHPAPDAAQHSVSSFTIFRVGGAINSFEGDDSVTRRLHGERQGGGLMILWESALPKSSAVS